MIKIQYIVAVLLLFATTASAEDICAWYEANFPAMADQVCGRSKASGGRGDSGLSGSSSRKASLSTNPDQNPASAPVHPTSYGIESIGSMTRGSEHSKKAQFALVKGFKKFGASVSTGPGNTFYNNDIVQRELGPQYLSNLDAREESVSKVPGLSISTALDITPAFFKGKARLNLGIGARHTAVTGSVGPIVGVQVHTPFFATGVSVSKLKISSRYDSMALATATATVRIPHMEFEYAVLENFGGPRLKPIHVFTVAVLTSRFIFTGAIRRLNYLPQGTVTQKHGGVQMLVLRKASIGYLYNYLPGAHSVAAQLFL